MNFLIEFWNFFKIRKKYWLLPIIFCFIYIWWINSVKPRFGCSPIYLHNFLNLTSILGISFYHDSAAALIIDGKIIAAAQEERFTKNKNMIQAIHLMQ